MAFIDKAGEILKKSLTQTLEDPEQLKRGLELFARGITLPDADDSTGDLSESAFALGRFRQEARKRDQEDIAAANKAQREYEEKQKLAQLQFKKEELDRKITADVELARLREQGDQQRAKDRRLFDQKTNARNEHVLFLSDVNRPLELMMDVETGGYNEFGQETLQLAGLELSQNTIKKLFRAKKRQQELHFQKLNKQASKILYCRAFGVFV